MYALLLSIIYVAFVGLGLPDSLLGAGWPAMHQDLGVSVAFAGLVTMIIMSGTIASSLASERLTRRFGAGLVTTVSVGMTAVALLGFSFSGEFWMICLWAIPYGLGAGAVDAALNNYVALHYAAKHMNWLHSFWGVGASISPFIMSFALTNGFGWGSAYLTVGIIQVVLTVALILSLPLWGRVNRIAPPDGEGDGEGRGKTEAGAGATNLVAAGATNPARAKATSHVPIMQALRIPGVILVLLAFFAYSALETTTALWSATYLVGHRNIDPATAAAFGALFLLGITAGRFMAGFVADRVGDATLIRGGFIMVGAGVVMLALPVDTNVIALAGLVVAGLGSAPIYPAIIHSTPINFGRRNSQAIIGIQMAAAYTGSTLAPPFFGLLATWLGMWVLPVFLGLFVALGVFMSERLNRLVGARATTATRP